MAGPYGTTVTVGPLAPGETQVVAHGLVGTPTIVQPTARPTGIGVVGTPTAATVTFANNATATETADFLVVVAHSILGIDGNDLYRGMWLTIDSTGITFSDGSHLGTAAPTAVVATATLDFGTEDHTAYTAVPYPALGATDRVACTLFGEDAIVQELVVGVVSETPGVGFTIVGQAPNGASGNVQVRCLIAPGV
jgi:hypothetical protein